MVKMEVHRILMYDFELYMFSKNYNLYINLACLFVCLYPINVKTDKPIGPKFFVGHHVTTGKVYE